MRTPALSAVACAFGHACVAVGAFGAVAPAPPTVRRLSSSAGPSGGGATVWIVGSGLSQATGVRFGTAAARIEGVASDDEIEVAAPRGTGTVAVTVTSPWGVSPATTSDRFKFVPAPTVAGLSPRAGPVSGGTVVRVVGADLAGAVSVHFGVHAARIDRIVSASEVIATAPAGSGVVDVTVTTVGGTSARSVRDRYTY